MTNHPEPLHSDPFAPDWFSPDFATARGRWLALAAERGAAMQSHLHPLKGPSGETLAMDVVRDGPDDATDVLLTTSGVHGVEAHGGCGIQMGLLAQGQALRALAGPDVALVHVHAVNPHGFAFGRRVTHENADLNRNFIDFGQPLPVNADYALLHDLLLPQQWPPSADNEAKLAELQQTWTPRRAQMAVSMGQHSHPDGLFFGGLGPTWSNLAFRQALRQHAGHCRRLVWIDLHTGLGPFGVGEHIFASDDTERALPRARRWWGEDKITSVHTGSSTSIPMTGPIQRAVDAECQQAEYTGICLEFGTLPLAQMQMALRADHWLHQHPEAAAALAAGIRRQIRNAFYCDSDAWRQALWSQGLKATRAALAGLRADADRA